MDLSQRADAIEANGTPGASDWPLRWSGRWIAPEPPAQVAAVGLGGGEPGGTFSRSLFRRTFERSEVPAAVPTRLTADSRYVLWVNGAEVGRGPARSQPYRQRYDEYDLAPYLRPGGNVIAVVVTYYGKATSFWQPAPAGASTDAVRSYPSSRRSAASHSAGNPAGS